jgi:Glycosyl transferase family 2
VRRNSARGELAAWSAGRAGAAWAVVCFATLVLASSAAAHPVPPPARWAQFHGTIPASQQQKSASPQAARAHAGIGVVETAVSPSGSPPGGSSSRALWIALLIVTAGDACGVLVAIVLYSAGAARRRRRAELQLAAVVDTRRCYVRRIRHPSHGHVRTHAHPAAWPPPVPAGRGISVVIPTLNEAENLPAVLERLPEEVDEVIIVDGGSMDGTPEVARALRPDAQIIRQRGRGKGDALGCGFEHSRGDIIVMLDADGSTDPAEIPRFVSALVEGATYAKGSRFMTGGGSADITRLRRAGNRVLNALVNALFGTRYTDLCYGYNAFWRLALVRMDIDCAGFEVETLMNIRAAKAGFAIVEVPSFEDIRIAGESKLNARRDGLRILRTIISERLPRRHVHRASPMCIAAPRIRPLDCDDS